jgi:hypothetical protein
VGKGGAGVPTTGPPQQHHATATPPVNDNRETIGIRAISHSRLRLARLRIGAWAVLTRFAYTLAEWSAARMTAALADYRLAPSPRDGAADQSLK